MQINDIENIYPLSPVQESILAERREPSWRYVACELQGELDHGALAAAWQTVVQQHPELRTSFFTQRLDKPVQVVHKQVAVSFEQHDWRALSRAEQDQLLDSLPDTKNESGSDITKAPLLSLELFHTAENLYKVVLSCHRVLLDEPSLHSVLEEVLCAYEQVSEGETLTPKKRQSFRNYLSWIKQQDTSRAGTFWREMLNGVSVSTLPPSAERGTLGATITQDPYQHLQLSTSTTEALLGIGLSLQALVLGALALLLKRYNRESEVVLGVSISGRPSDVDDVNSLLGTFVQTLPLRIQVTSQQTVLSWLKGLHEQLADCRNYCHFPPKRSEASAHFDCELVLEPLESHTLSKREIRRLGQDVHGIKLSFQPGPELTLQLAYNRSRFTTANISTMLSHLEVILQNIAADPHQQLSRVSCLTDAERQELLREWNPYHEYAPHHTIHELFEAQVSLTPDTTAVIAGDAQLTYRELNTRANQLAHQLRRRGVGPEVLVGLCVERSLELVVGVLGILKAGSAYLPMDPAYPRERLAFVLADSQVRVVLTEERLLSRLPTDVEHLICFDRDSTALDRESDENLVSGSVPGNLAYVIYTSGSTGQPKGVQITHANVVRLFDATKDSFQFDEHDVWTLFHSYAFDFSVWEIWGALLYGGRLVVVPYWISRSPNTFYEFLCAQHVTVLNQTPSAFYQLIRAQESASPDRKHCLRFVVFGGEALDLNTLGPWFDRHGDRQPRLVNMYGITETTVHVTHRELFAEDLNDASASVIGRPIPDLTAYLLDSDLQPVPIGIPGELYVGGAGLARGYLGRAELTAERFIPNPFSEVPGARLYRSGDLATFLSSGEMEYLGRTDEQVKIRGFRIELGEIEAALTSHDAVREAAVVVREESGVGKRLVAYVVAQSDLIGQELREHLSGTLPDYMVPSAVVSINELPLTTNGKLDRKALADRQDIEAEEVANYVAPRTAIEELLCGIWSEVLGIDRLGVDWNFFELGGHSLLATQVMSRVRETFNVDVPLRTLFERPTIGELGAEIEAHLQGEKTAPRRISPTSCENGAPLSFAQQRLWFIDQLDPGSAAYNIHTPVRLQGQLDVSALERALSEVIRRHEVLRTTFKSIDGEGVQIVGEATPLKLVITDLGKLSDEDKTIEVGQLVAEEAGRPFDLSRGPLLRASLLRLRDQEHVVLLTMHHIISDGWSMGVFVKEVATLYEAFTRGQDSPLEELPVQYADYATWQRERLQGEVLQRQLDYWREQLTNAPPVLELPVEHDRTSASGLGAIQTFTLSSQLSSSLRELSQRHGVTLFMTLLSAFQIVLHHYTDQEDIIVGSNVVGRTQRETEPLIGFFINMLVLRTPLSGDPGFSEVLRRVREVTLGAYVHQDVPFEKLIEELQPERSMGQTPFVQVVLNFEMAKPQSPQIQGLELSQLEQGMPAVKFDLTLNMQDTSDAMYGAWLYDRELFTSDVMARMTRHLQRVLETAVADPEAKLKQVREILAEDDRQLRLLKEKELQKTSLLKLQVAKRKAVVGGVRAWE